MQSNWSSITRLCQRLLVDVDEIARRTTDMIRSELPGYALVELDEHRAAVRGQIGRRLRAFSERRAWEQDDLDQAIALARRRARQGIPVDMLMSAYHVGDRELWGLIISDPGEAIVNLPELAALMLESMKAVSTALASAHTQEARAQHSIRATVSQRLVDLLVTEPHGPEAERLASFLGFDTRGSFLALAWKPDEPHIVTLESHGVLDGLSGNTAHAQLKEVSVLLVQGMSNARLEEVVVRMSARGLVGRGSVHAGVSRASVSVEQAELALTLATTAVPIVSFADSWLECCTTDRSELLRSETGAAVELAHSKPYLADTVLDFAAANMSLAQCARDSGLHANSVSYRLDRWQALTGWNPRLFADLSRSVVACQLAGTRRVTGEPVAS